jgi:hypothetical protein
VLTGTFQLILHKQHTLKGTPLESLNYPWLETPTQDILHGFSAGSLPYLGYLAGAPGDRGPAPTVGYWTEI